MPASRADTGLLLASADQRQIVARLGGGEGAPVRARWHGGVDSGKCLVWCLVVVVVAPGAPELRCVGVAWCGAARQKLAESVSE